MDKNPAVQSQSVITNSLERLKITSVDGSDGLHTIKSLEMDFIVMSEQGLKADPDCSVYTVQSTVTLERSNI